VTDTEILTGKPATGRDDIDLVIQSSRRALGCLAPDVEPGVDVASWLNITRFAESSGDENPLYTDPQYGAGSAHHTMLAPPTFVLAVCQPASAAVLDYLTHQLADNLTSLRLAWDDTIRLGDPLSGRVCVADVARRYTEKGQARACVVSTVEYRRNEAEFARGRAEVELAPLDEETAFSSRRPLHRYEPADIERLVRELDAERPCRGQVPRYWSDVAVGEPTSPTLKGPLTLSDLMVWTFAEGREVRAGNLEYARLAARKGRRATHPVTGWAVWDRADASLDSAVTAPAGPAAPGGLLVTLVGQHVTNWMGDDAFLRQLDVRIRAAYRYGDILRLTGSVVDRDTRSDEVSNRYHTVTLGLTGVNQLGERVIEADAVVFLPDRGKPVKLPVRGGLRCDTLLEG
jgi:acyl dehydratase